MCNPKLLLVILSLCQSYFTTSTNPVVTADQCFRAVDICIDRKMWEYEGLAVSPRSVEEQEQFAIEECDFYVLERSEFSQYYTDRRCGY